MKAKSTLTGGYCIYAVSGTNSISFAIDFEKANTKGLLGFAVERINRYSGERKYMDGFKVFEDLIKKPNVNTVVSTYTHPIQSFVWDDFACYDNTVYTYLFYPVTGSPKNQTRAKTPITISIRTEKLFSGGAHDIFFNRGVASSQAYRRKFFNLPPDKITNPAMKKEALNWLSRSLDEAILQFIDGTVKGETLLGCFYEFHYAPVVKAFARAIGRGVQVKLIIDAKDNSSVDKNGNFHEAFPREANLTALADAGIPTEPAKGYVIQREAKKNDIQHNKFIIRSDKSGVPKEVWTGSTNISEGGIHGQTNVGHRIRNSQVAKKFKAYWDLLSQDPGSKEGDDRSDALKKNNALKKSVETLQPNISFNSWDDIPMGITPVFSPRSGSTMLETYVQLMDNAENIACITLAFGINELFKDYLEDNTASNAISFLLLEKEDKPKTNSKKKFRYIGAKQNVYKSFGAYIEDDLYQWARETTNRHMGLNSHVVYIHSKFLLVDPLGDDPVVITGSANFSEASTNDNDENMVIIRGDQRVADIYFTEFNRLFHHYYFRSVYKNAKENKRNDDESLFLKPNDSWIRKSYKKGQLRYKRVKMFTQMKGFKPSSFYYQP